MGWNHREFDGLYRGFVLVDDEEFAELNASRVHRPEHVSRDLSTDDLVGFAEAGYEAVWCFDISRPGIDGEYPVCFRRFGAPASVRAADAQQFSRS